MSPYVPKTVYTSFSEVNEPQTNIMRFVDRWVHEKKTPIPLKEIIMNMKIEGIEKDTIIYSLKILLKKGYIRRAVTISNKTTFVQLRRV